MTRRIAALLLLSLLTACSGVKGPDQSNPSSVLLQKSIWVGTYDTQPVVRSVDGKLSVLYANAKGQIEFLQSGKHIPLSLPSDGDGLRFLKMDTSGQSVWATWWTHANGKKIFVAESQDGGKSFSPRLIATPKTAQPLPPYAIIPAAGKQPAALIYSDERTGPYHIYINELDPSKGAWGSEDIQLDVGPLTMNPSGVQAAAYSNTVLRQNTNLVLAWITKIQTPSGVEYRLLSRASHDNGATWGNVEEIAHSRQEIFNLIGTVADDGKVFAYSFQDGTSGIRVVTSIDGGATWHVSAPLADSGLNTNSGNVIAAGRGSTKNILFLSWIAQKPIGKPWIMAASYDLQGHTWITGQTRIDRKPYDNTMSVMPSVAVNDSGVALISWVDYRNILPNIYVSGSFNGGKTWTEPQNTQMDGEAAGVVSAATSDKNNFLVSYDLFTDNSHKNMDLQVLKLSPVDTTGFGPLPKQKSLTVAEKEQRLRDRLKQFWEDRIKGQPGKNYSFFDPAFRAMNDQNSFDKVQGYYKYYSYSIKSIKIEGNVAHVDVGMNFEIPETKIFGHDVKQQRRDAVGGETWLWIGDNWYFQYTNPMTGPLLVY